MFPNNNDVFSDVKSMTIRNKRKSKQEAISRILQAN